MFGRYIPMKYKCEICGEVFEIPAGEEVVCPLCYASGDVIKKLDDAIKELPVGDKSAVYNIGYGLYVVTSNDGKKDNGMICNTVVQLTSDPMRVLVSINKANYTHDIVKETRLLNVCRSRRARLSPFLSVSASRAAEIQINSTDAHSCARKTSSQFPQRTSTPICPFGLKAIRRSELTESLSVF